MKINKRGTITWTGFLALLMLATSCHIPLLVSRKEIKSVPSDFGGKADSASAASVNWKEFFQDKYLVSLIDTALKNNQELNILLEEIEISKNEVQIRNGEYRPFVKLGGGMGYEKAARYTQVGASEATTDIKPGKEMPEPLGDFWFGAHASWEVDIWKKMRTAKKSAIKRYLASVEGRNFMITNLISEIAESYYELLALDSQLQIIGQNVEIQNNALKMVRLQKEATKVTELAVKRFEAQVLNTQSLRYSIQQQIVEAENRINYLVGRFPQPVERDKGQFLSGIPASVQIGTPSLLFSRRADIRQAELELEGAKLDVAVARADFYPSLGLSASLGTQAFDPLYLAKMPLSLFSTLAGDLVGPLVNKQAIKANYQTANAQQTQAVHRYEQTVLSACNEVATLSARIGNLEKIYELKSKEVQALTESVTISNRLFASARADYTEVLLTQREMLDSKFELIETKMEQWSAMVKAYRALGGGWE